MEHMRLEVSEIFSSLQGEGPYTGRPAVFLRLSRCVPPHCPWCDTPYALGKGENMSPDQVRDRMLAFAPAFAVITGGEPFLQWGAGLALLEKKLMAAGMEIQYETSGKLPIPVDCRGIKICSPKFIDGAWRYAEENTGRADLFKFPAAPETEDLDRILKFVEKRDIPKEMVWIMPLGISRKTQLERMPALWDFCTARGFNLSSRLHILTFDEKRGV
ncbi:MAG TPA: 7-carboxy-7-deazaguanine synthase QueE [Desulfobacteraceae bacterium]|nr:7-carboxy-7-deazaguanine synthase QueE [Desulfobacteraceae bacterium]